MTLEERLAEERIVFLWGEIGPNMAGGLIMRLLELQSKSPGREISLYINSPGGSVDDTLAIYDTMQFVNCDVATYCVGQAASGAAIILAAGTKGKRLRPAAQQGHDPPALGRRDWTGRRHQDPGRGDPSRPRSSLTSCWPHHTGRTPEQITQETERDRYLSPAEALEYGLIDEIVAKEPKKK